jgi:hypothetical protein
MRIAGVALMGVMSIFSGSAQGTPDRSISVTGIEHRADTYKVTGKAWILKSGSLEPTLSYQLSCGSTGGYLEVGKIYKASEAYSKDGTKILLIFEVKSKPEQTNIGCDVESVKSIDQR